MLELPINLQTPINTCHASLLEQLRHFAYRKGSFTLASGKQSDFYIDCRDVVLSAQGHILVGRCIEDIVRQHFKSAIAIGGMSIGANPLASATACISQLSNNQSLQTMPTLDAFYVRKQPKGHGTQKYIEGLRNLEASNTPRDVVIVEDVITTGASTELAIKRVIEAKLSPIGVIALVDREEGGVTHLSQFAPVRTLFTRSDFIR